MKSSPRKARSISFSPCPGDGTGFILLILFVLGNTGIRAESGSAASAKPVFTNSISLPFVEVKGTKALFCIWETRVQDYQIFARTTGRRTRSPGFSQTSSHPAVMVSWEDATQFCRWLTDKEIESGRIPEGSVYRLPTSAEWSLAVGLEQPTGDDTLAMVEGPSQTDFPWEGTWPPGKGAGNYHPNLNCESFTYTSPVGSHEPNQFGLYDMGGNAWEWCLDPFKNSIDFRVLRGGSWRMRSPGDLLSSLEIGNVSHIQLNTYGFRIVLELPEGTTAKDLPKE